jgi:hypothetical protein
MKRLLLNLLEINIFPNPRGVGAPVCPGTFRSRILGGSSRPSGISGSAGAGLVIHLLPFHLAELFANLAGGPENRDQEAGNKPVQEIEKDGKKNNIHMYQN